MYLTPPTQEIKSTTPLVPVWILRQHILLSGVIKTSWLEKLLVWVSPEWKRRLYSRSRLLCRLLWHSRLSKTWGVWDRDGVWSLQQASMGEPLGRPLGFLSNTLLSLQRAILPLRDRSWPTIESYKILNAWPWTRTSCAITTVLQSWVCSAAIHHHTEVVFA